MDDFNQDFNMVVMDTDGSLRLFPKSFSDVLHTLEIADKGLFLMIEIPHTHAIMEWTTGLCYDYDLDSDLLLKRATQQLSKQSENVYQKGISDAEKLLKSNNIEYPVNPISKLKNYQLSCSTII